MDSQTTPSAIRLGFIGGGKLAGSVIRGLVRAKYCAGAAILVSEPNDVARRVAAMLGYLYLDSGATYRALALKALRHGASLNDEVGLETLAKETHIELQPPKPEQEAAGAITKFNGMDFEGRALTVNEARPMVPRDGGGGGGGRGFGGGGRDRGKGGGGRQRW